VKEKKDMFMSILKFDFFMDNKRKTRSYKLKTAYPSFQTRGRSKNAKPEGIENEITFLAGN